MISFLEMLWKINQQERVNNLWEIIENFQCKKIKLSEYEKLFKNESEELVLSNYLKIHLEFDMSFIKKLKGGIFSENIE